MGLLHVVGTCWYLLLPLQFPTRMLNEGELKDLNVLKGDTHLEAMKRYSEFVTLHNKLLKTSDFARHVKGTKITSCLICSHVSVCSLACSTLLYMNRCTPYSRLHCIQFHY